MREETEITDILERMSPAPRAVKVAILAAAQRGKQPNVMTPETEETRTTYHEKLDAIIKIAKTL